MRRREEKEEEKQREEQKKNEEDLIEAQVLKQTLNGDSIVFQAGKGWFKDYHTHTSRANLRRNKRKEEEKLKSKGLRKNT